jgi:hypothetical protein
MTQTAFASGPWSWSLVHLLLLLTRQVLLHVLSLLGRQLLSDLLLLVLLVLLRFQLLILLLHLMLQGLGFRLPKP